MIPQPPIITCAEWGALPPRGDLTRATPTGSIVHHMAWPNRPAITDHAQAIEHAKSVARQCQRDHFAQNPPWADTGQGFTITRDGIICEGRHGSIAAVLAGHSIHGAHCADPDTGVNRNADIGVECEGTYITDQMPAVQWAALVWLKAWICFNCHLDSATIEGHRTTGCRTQCPGDWLASQIPTLQRQVHDRLVASK